MERRSVRQVHERNARLRIPPGAHQTPDRTRRILRRLASQDRAHAERLLLHGSRVTRAQPGCPAAQAKPLRRAAALGSVAAMRKIRAGGRPSQFARFYYPPFWTAA